MAVKGDDKLTIDERLAEFGFQDDEDTAVFFENSETGRRLIDEMLVEIEKKITEKEEMAIMLATEEQQREALVFDDDEEAETKERWRAWQEDGAFHLHPSEKEETPAPNPEIVDRSMLQEALQQAQKEHSKANERDDHYDKNIKEGDKFSLLGQHQPLTDTSRDAAEQDFLRKQPELSSRVKNLERNTEQTVAPSPSPVSHSLQPMPDSAHPLAHLAALEDEIKEHQHLSAPS